MTTLSHLRTLLDLALTHTENPALGRCERTVEGVAAAYLPRWMSAFHHRHTRRDGSGHDVSRYANVLGTQRAVSEDAEDVARYGWARMDLTDPGTAHALLVGLALAKGLDPGVGAMLPRWRYERMFGDSFGWSLSVSDDDGIEFVDGAEWLTGTLPGVFDVPTVANEPNPIAALEAAVKHTVEGR